MSTSITTDQDLLDGVESFPRVSAQVLESLTPADLRHVGRTTFHEAAWRRCIEDLEQRGIDEDYVSDDAEAQLKPAICHLVMYLLYRQNIIKMDDRNALNAEYHENQYQRIFSTKALELTSGTADRLGRTFSIRRG